MLPEINSYLELVKKLDYDLERYSRTNHIYELLDCFMTLNSLPEWIKGSPEASQPLKGIAEAKLKIMKGQDFTLDVDKLDTDIDHQLRFIRLICNHSKHKTDSSQIPIIKSMGGSAFPATLPVKFDIVAIGDKEVDAEDLINRVANFWKTEINK
jgi:hypothetical protein